MPQKKAPVKPSVNGPANAVNEPMLILKGQEIQQFEQLIDTFPHGYAKQIISFFNAAQQRRQMEKVQVNVPVPASDTATAATA